MRCYDTSIKAFVIVLCKMLLKKGVVTFEFTRDMYEKVHIENFIESK